MSSKPSSRLKVMWGLKSKSALRIPPSSSPTPRICTSWPSASSVRTTSYSVFHGCPGSASGSAVTGGTRSGWTSASTRSFLAGGFFFRLTAAPGGGPCQQLHRVEGELEREVEARLLLRAGEAEAELAAADDDA